MAGAPKGNKNAVKAKVWELALRHQIAADRERLYRIAENVLKLAEAGEQWAVTEVRNTLDGKPKEHVEVNETRTIIHDDRLSALRSGLRTKAEEPETRTVQ